MSTTLRFDSKQTLRQTPSLIRTTDTPSTSPSLTRRQPLLQRSLSMSTPRASSCTGGATAAEFCGGTTASCAAVWCCCPCGLGKLLVLAVYKVPAGLCRRALRRRRRKHLVKSGLLPPPPRPEIDRSNRRNRFGSSEFAVHPLESRELSDEDEDDFLELKVLGRSTMATMLAAAAADEEEDAAVTALEKEMWNRFYGAGFWRSPSQRETVSSPRVSKSVAPSPRPSFTYRNTMTRGGCGTTVGETPRTIRQ